MKNSFLTSGIVLFLISGILFAGNILEIFGRYSHNSDLYHTLEQFAFTSFALSIILLLVYAIFSKTKISQFPGSSVDGHKLTISIFMSGLFMGLIHPAVLISSLGLAASTISVATGLISFMLFTGAVYVVLVENEISKLKKKLAEQNMSEKFTDYEIFKKIRNWNLLYLPFAIYPIFTISSAIRNPACDKGECGAEGYVFLFLLIILLSIITPLKLLKTYAINRSLGLTLTPRSKM